MSRNAKTVVDICLLPYFKMNVGNGSVLKCVQVKFERDIDTFGSAYAIEAIGDMTLFVITFLIISCQRRNRIFAKSRL